MLYSLYQRAENGFNWRRVSSVSLPKTSAVSLFQSILIGGACSAAPELRLRPIKSEAAIGNQSGERVFELRSRPYNAA